MLNVMRKFSYRILQHDDPEYPDFLKIIDFLRNYADKHHHGKEEKLLFNKMADELGSAGEKLVTHGMLVEHDLGRLYIMQLEDAVNRVIAGDEEAKLDVIGNAIGYSDLLHRHIDKEDRVVYEFARNHLAEATLEQVNIESQTFEDEAKKENIQARYLGLLGDLEAKI